jgi:putative MATE family efflux protein
VARRWLPLAHPHDREILRLAVPALGALAAEPLYILADTAVVGRLGTPQLGGLAVASTIVLTGYAVFIFLAYGTTASVSRLVGAGDERLAAHQAVQGMWLGAGIGAVLAVAGLAAARPLVDLLGASDSVRPYALTYLRISLLGVPSLLLVLAGTGYFRGLQDTRTPLVVAVVSAVANLAIELVLVFPLDTGVAGSAWSTVIAQTGAAAAYVRWVARDVRRRDVPVRPDWPSVRRAAAVGVDLFVRTVSLRLALSVATAVAARRGTLALGAHQIAFELWNFLALVLDSVAIAGQAMVGRLLGAGRPDDARAAARRMIEWGVGVGAVLGLAVAGLRPWLPHVFTDDAPVVAVTAFLLWYVAVLQPLNGAVFVLDGVLIGAGDMRYLAWAMAISAAAFIPAAAAVLVFDLGIGWLWAAITLLMVVRLATLGARFAGTAWQVVGADRTRQP